LIASRKLDLESLGKIYDQFSPGIYRYAVRLLGDDDVAEDCVAETFSRFLRALQTGSGPQEYLKAYLYRIAHNWITDYYRRQSPITQTLDDSIKSDGELRIENQVEARMEKENIRLALRALTPDQRQVVVLFYIEDWNHADIAAAMQKPIGAVKALQHRAVQSLKKILPGEEVNTDA